MPRFLPSLFSNPMRITSRAIPRFTSCRLPSTQVPNSCKRTYTSSIVYRMAQEYRLSVSPSSLKNGGKAEAEVEGIEEGKVLLVKTNGKIHAMSANCTHYGAPLVKGVFDGRNRVTCPWHGGAYTPRFQAASDRKRISRSFRKCVGANNAHSMFQYHNRRCRGCTGARLARQIRSAGEEWGLIHQGRGVRH